MIVFGVFFNPEIRTGGHRRYLEFFQDLVDKGHEVNLILNSELNYQFRGINEIRIDYQHKKKVIPYSLVSLLVLMKKKKSLLSKELSCDFIVIHGETHLFAGVYLKKLLKSKLLFALRSNGVVEARMKLKEGDVSIKKKVSLIGSGLKYSFYEKYAARNADILAFQSDFDKKSLISRNRFYSNKAVIIPGNIGGEWFKRSLKDINNSENLLHLVFVGAINQRKGIRYLIEAFISLCKKGLDLTVDIVGDGGQRGEMESLINQNNLSEKAHFRGKVSNPLDYISKGDLVVVPSVFDSFPDVILESLHVGTPVIASRSGGMPEMVTPSALFDVASTVSLTKKIEELYFSPDSYMNLKKELREHKRRFEFDWTQAFVDEMAKKLL